MFASSMIPKSGYRYSEKIMPNKKLKLNVDPSTNHFALAAKFEQGIFGRPRRDSNMGRAGLT